MNFNDSKLIKKVIDARVSCIKGICFRCPYVDKGMMCGEYLLLDCVKLLLSDLDPSHCVFKCIRDLINDYCAFDKKNEKKS